MFIIFVGYKIYEIIYWFYIFDCFELNILGLVICFYVINLYYIGVLCVIELRCFVNVVCNVWWGYFFIIEKSGCFFSKIKSYLFSNEFKFFVLCFVIDLFVEKSFKEDIEG